MEILKGDEIVTREDHKKMFMELMTKSKEDIENMVNTGFFNEIIQGYAIGAMERAGLSNEEQKKVIGSFSSVFDDVKAGEARSKYKNFRI